MIYTIGHSNHTIEHFIGLLKRHDISLLVDVRSIPYSKRNSQFNRENLLESLKENNISYLDLGKTLGGMPEDKTVLNLHGRINLEKIETKSWYTGSIKKIIELSASEKLATMCSEEDPKHCHRGHIITNSLLKLGEVVLHIRKDYSLQTAEKLERQSELFE